jgi:hypothetical protein
MLTAGDIEFEPPQTKIVNFTSSIAALVAGDAAFQVEIIAKVQADVDAQIKANPTVWITVEEVGQIYLRHYNSARFKRAENAILAPLGMDSTSFVNNQQKMSPQLVDKLAAEILNFEVPDTATIFAGVDSGGAHIYTAQKEVISCNDVVGFSAIGAGAWHADSQLMFAAHTKWNVFGETLLTTYASKKRAEVAPGVGTATDMFYIGPNLGSYILIGDHVIKKLEKFYKEEQGKQTKARQKSRAQANDYIEELTKSATPKEQGETPKDAGRTEAADATEATTEEQSASKQAEEGGQPQT